MYLNVIVSIDNNRCIGNNNELIYDIKEDKKYFREITIGKKLHNIGFKFIVVQYLHPGQALPATGLNGLSGQIILKHVLAQLIGKSWNSKSFDGTTGICDGIKNFISTVFKRFCDITEGHVITTIWRIRPIGIHGILIFDVLKRGLNG